MKETLIKSVIEKLGEKFVALYQYKKNEKDMLILVLTDMDFVFMADFKKYFEGEKLIVLSMDDVNNGSDIFALKFLHMQHHAILFDGKDVLNTVEINRHYLRQNLEAEIRNTLIEFREAFLTFKGERRYLKYILPVMETIWEGVLYLYERDISKDVLDMEGDGYEFSEGLVLCEEV